MKIIYLHQYFVEPGGAGGTRSYEFGRRLAAAGHEIHIVTSDTGGAAPRGWHVEELAGFHVHRLSVPYHNGMSFSRRIWSFARFAWGSAWRAARLAKNADVIFATSTPLTIAIPSLLASAVRRVPMVFEVRDVWPEVPIAMGALRNPILIKLASWLERFTYKRSRHVVALSPGMKESIIRSGVDPAKVTVIPNSCDIAEFDSADRDDDLSALVACLSHFPVVLYAGTIGIANGCSYLVNVATEAAKNGDEFQILIVGDGKEATKVRQLAHDAGVLGRNLFMLPPVPKRQVPALMRRADLSISTFIDHPALWANSANKFFDTLASGTAVAVNYGGWQAELIAEGGLGLVLPPTDHASAARQIAAFLGNPAQVKEAGLRARLVAEERFSRDKLAAKLENILRAAA